MGWSGEVDGTVQVSTDDATDAAFDVKAIENDVHVSPNGSDKTNNKKHDEKTKRDDKGKSHVDTPTGVRDLRAEFEEFSYNSTNRVNDVSAPVTVGPNPTNSTNSFNTASPSDTAVSLNFGIAGKSSFMDPSIYPDDLDMPELENIVYSDDEEDVVAEADLSNLETNIFVSHILTTRFHKDHPITQIIGDLTLTLQTRSMTRMVKEQGGLHQINDEDFYTSYASFMGFMVYQMVVNSDFLYRTIEEEVKQKNDGIFISQDKYVAEILRKFGFTDIKLASTPIETEKPLLKDLDDQILCLLFVYVPDSKLLQKCHICMKLKGFLGLWYPKDSPFNLVAYSDSDYARASLDKKFTTGGCQFLGYRLIYWQCKKQTVVATSSTKAKYVAAASYCAQVLWIQKQLLDYGMKLLKQNLHKEVVVTKDVIRRDLHLDDADGVECLLNEEIFAELTRMGYEKPHLKLTFYKAFFSAQCRKFNFSNYIFHSIVRNVDCPSKILMYLRFLQVIINDLVDDVTSHNTKYTSPALIQKKVVELEHDKHTQALEILKLKQRVKKLENKKRSKSLGLKRGKIKAIDADKDITLVDAETQVDMDVELQGRIDQDASAATKDVNVAEPTIFDDEESVKLQVEEDSEIARDLVIKIFMEANKPKSKSLDNITKDEARSAGRPAAESLKRGTGVRDGRGGRGRRLGEGCSYKEFLACNPKEYDGKGGVVVLTRWIEKMENVQEMSGCSVDQKVKYTTGSFMEFCPSHEMQKLETELWNHAMVGVVHAAYTNRFHKLARLVPHLVTLERRKIKRYVYGLALQIRGMVAATEPKTIQKAEQISCALTDEAVRNGSIKKVENRENVRESSKDKNGRDDNKRTRTGNAFASTANPVERDNMGVWPKCITCNSYHAPRGSYHTCFNCNRPSHLAKDCRGVPRNVNHVNARNLTVKARYECGSTDHGPGNQWNQARGREFMLGVEEARQDPNIVTGMFTLNNHFATTIFDPGVDYSFVSTTFIPQLGIEPSELGFRYEIEIASRKLVEIDKVIKGCKLEIEGHVFDIDLIHFGHRSFDVIVGMDLLSNHKAKIMFYEKVVRILLLDDKVLRILRERPKEKVKFMMSVKASDKKQGEIVVVRGFQKCKTFDWGEEQELAFQTLKDKLCNAPVLALADGTKDFVVYCDVSGIGLGCVLMQKELFSDYHYEIRYHPRKAKVVADALSRKERVNPKRVRAMNITLQSSIKDRILTAQKEEGIAMDFVTKLPRTSSGHDTIWVIVDRLTKSAHFLPMSKDYKMDRLARLYLNEIVARYGVPISIILDRDSHFTSRFWQSMQKALETSLDMSTSYHPQIDGHSERTI
uniref:Reverse transcriptase domain-containing protein n=1 Tax=Tanacetum cinerariifolium TaxID=118510 RepID=A0A6L2MGD8_TANCI|nr:hypothetical protein [Tanacetum cinerariifolium]